MVISSRNQQKVDAALENLKSMNLSVSGRVCHVANDSHRKELVQTVRFIVSLHI